MNGADETCHKPQEAFEALRSSAASWWLGEDHSFHLGLFGANVVSVSSHGKKNPCIIVQDPGGVSLTS